MGVDTAGNARARRRDPGHLHQLVGGDQSLRRRTRRHRLHLDQRRGGDDVGVGARREAADAAGPASRPQHRLQDGRAARPRWSCGIRTRVWGGLTPEQVKHAKLILWKGHCSVHTRFTVPQIDAFRKQYPAGQGHRAPRVHVRRRPGGRRAAARPSTSSTPSRTARWAASGRSRPRSIWSTGWRTRSRPSGPSITLDPFGCLCSTMFRVSPNHLLWMLEGLVDGQDPQPDRRPRAGEEPGAAWRSTGCSRCSNPWCNSRCIRRRRIPSGGVAPRSRQADSARRPCRMGASRVSVRRGTRITD